MTNRDDEKLEELGMEISKHKVGSPGRMCAEARYGGFRDGASHVRNSAEWKAMEKAVEAAEEWMSDMNQEEYGHHPEWQALSKALSELDRLRGDK